MASRVGSVIVDLRANTASFIRELDKSRTFATAFGVSIGGIMQNVAESIGRLAAESIKALPQLTKEAIDLGDNLNKLSQKTGISVETLSRLRLAAETSDVGLESLGTGLRNLSRNMSEAVGGSKSAQEKFKTLGIEVTGTGGRIKSVREVMLASADAISKMGDGAQKTAAAVGVFGKSGDALIPFLNHGSDGIAEMEDQAAKLGLTISTETAQAMEDFNDDLKILEESAKAVGISIAESVLPALDKITEGAKFFREAISIDIDEAFRAKELKTTNENLREIPEFLNQIDQAAKDAGVSLKLLGNIPTNAAVDLQKLRDNIAGFREDLDRDVGGLPKLATKLSPEEIEAQRKATEAAAKSLEQLVSGFKDSLKPADALNAELLKIANSGATTQQILAVYGEQILKAFEAQKAHGEIIPVYISQLNAIAQAQDEASQSLENWTGVMDTSAAGMGLFLESMVDASKAPVLVTDALEKLGATNDSIIDGFKAKLEGVRDAFGLLGLKTQQELEQIAKATEEAYERSGLAAEQGSQRELTARIAMLEAQKEAIIAAGNEWTEIQQKQLETAQKEFDKLANQNKLKEEFKEIGETLSRGIEDAIRKWEGFGKLAIGILDDIAATILRNQVTAPLTGWLSDVLGSLGSVIGGIGGGGASSAPLPIVGAFAEGGPVKSGLPVLVGEEQKEIFLPYKKNLDSFVRGMDGAQLNKFPNLNVKMPELSSSRLAKITKGLPVFVGDKGPEIFKPPVPGTIVPLDKPEGQALLKKMQKMGLARAEGGSVSTSNSYMTGERGREIFAPTAMNLNESSVGGALVINNNVDARGSEIGVGQEIEKVFRNIAPALIEAAVAAGIERRLRGSV